MNSAIDFKELRRRERERHRSAVLVDSSSSMQEQEQEVRRETACVASTSQSGQEVALAPYRTLLRDNKLSEYSHRLRSPKMLNSVLYARNFLSAAQASEVMAWLKSIPDYCPGRGPKRDRSDAPIARSEREQSLEHNGKWTTLTHARRKVALFDGTVCDFPPILQRLSNTLVEIEAFPASNRPNHVLINEYQPGEGIMAHTDGPAYESCTATISLGGSDVIFVLWPRQRMSSIQPLSKYAPSLEVVLHGNGSLVVFKDDAYLNHCHAIREVLEERTSPNGLCGNDAKGGTVVKRGHRVSLTFRCKKPKSTMDDANGMNMSYSSG